jgi:ATP-dependent RNA helicase SUPV3L1/SUV3
MENLPSLPPFQEIRDYLETERETIIKVNAFSEDDDFIRSGDDAQIVLGFLAEVQTRLWKFFNKFPFFIPYFEKEYMPLREFFRREYIVELCFLDDYLSPERAFMAFAEDGNPDEILMGGIKDNFNDWCTKKESAHQKNLDNLKENFYLDFSSDELTCKCRICLADYKSRIRDTLFKECVEKLENTKEAITECVDDGIKPVSNLYYSLQKDLDKLFFRFRKKLKKSSLNRLESQVKNQVKAYFNYPSELAKKHAITLEEFFREMLRRQGLKQDLVGEMEYERFFRQLSSNIWKNEKYLEREFSKLLKSIMILKRKDISGKILQDYLGEFWIHSLARTVKRKIIYHAGPTNSGKTYFAVQNLMKAGKGCYLAPLRLLAAELYDTMNTGGVKTTLLTGEEVIETEGATHYSSTIEMARLQENFDIAVIDEIQMITDTQRGWAWTRALVNIMADEVHICGDPSVLDLVQQIVNLCGDTLEVKYYERMTDLSLSPRSLTVGELEKHDALVVFSRRNALRYKMDLERLGFKVSIVYGRLSPEVRREQARKFDQGETDIMVSTDAIAMGMNLPIKRIVFSTLSKFFDNQEYVLTKSEIKQIAGRAGRYQRFPEGKVTCLSRVEEGMDLIKHALETTLDQKINCMVGPDLDIFSQVNNALKGHALPILKLSEFLRLFNTMEFKKPFYCVDLKEMIELAEMVESADRETVLTSSEIFGFACAPVNLGLLEHVQYYIWILNHFVKGGPVLHEPLNPNSGDIDYLETSIKCVELYQWLSRHFNNKHFEFDEELLLENKGQAIERLNDLLSDKIVPTCNSCGKKLPESSKFAICEDCFKQRRFSRNRGPRKAGGNSKKFEGKGRPIKKKRRRR